jgi:hypothetical protein
MIDNQKVDTGRELTGNPSKFAGPCGNNVKFSSGGGA